MAVEEQNERGVLEALAREDERLVDQYLEAGGFLTVLGDDDEPALSQYEHAAGQLSAM